MQALVLLHLQHPFLVWCAVGAIFVSFEVATGEGRLIFATVAAVATGVLAAAGLRGAVEPAVFAALLAFEIAAAARIRARRLARRSALTPAPVLVIRPRTPMGGSEGSDEVNELSDADAMPAPVRRFGG